MGRMARAKEKHGIDGNRWSEIPKASALIVGRRMGLIRYNKQNLLHVDFRLLYTCIYPSLVFPCRIRGLEIVSTKRYSDYSLFRGSSILTIPAPESVCRV